MTVVVDRDGAWSKAKENLPVRGEKKMEILTYVDNHPHASQGEVGRKFGIGQSSVSTLIKNKAAIRELAAGRQVGVKKNRTSNCVSLERGLESFYEACQSKELKSITYDMLICKGQEIADELLKRGIVEAKNLPSSDKGWKSQVLLSKRSIKSRKTHGEIAGADAAAAESFFSEVWPEIFDGVDRCI